MTLCTDIIMWHDPTDICAICLDTMDEHHKIKTLICKHNFHIECVEKLKKNILNAHVKLKINYVCCVHCVEKNNHSILMI
jgi:hypothetical protein